MSGQSIISIISTNLGPFGANSVITFGMSFSIRWCTSIFQKLHRFSGNQIFGKSIAVNSFFKSRHIFNNTYAKLAPDTLQNKKIKEIMRYTGDTGHLLFRVALFS